MSRIYYRHDNQTCWTPFATTHIREICLINNVLLISSQPKRAKNSPKLRRRSKKRRHGSSGRKVTHVGFFFFWRMCYKCLNTARALDSTPPFVCRGSLAKSRERGAGETGAREKARRDRETWVQGKWHLTDTLFLKKNEFELSFCRTANAERVNSTNCTIYWKQTTLLSQNGNMMLWKESWWVISNNDKKEGHFWTATWLLT